MLSKIIFACLFLTYLLISFIPALACGSLCLAVSLLIFPIIWLPGALILAKSIVDGSELGFSSDDDSNFSLKYLSKESLIKINNPALDSTVYLALFGIYFIVILLILLPIYLLVMLSISIIITIFSTIYTCPVWLNDTVTSFLYPELFNSSRANLGLGIAAQPEPSPSLVTQLSASIPISSADLNAKMTITNNGFRNATSQVRALSHFTGIFNPGFFKAFTGYQPSMHTKISLPLLNPPFHSSLSSDKKNSPFI